MKVLSIILMSFFLVSSAQAGWKDKKQRRALYKKHRKERFTLTVKQDKDKEAFMAKGISPYSEAYFDFNEDQIAAREQLEDKQSQEKCDAFGGKVFCDHNNLKRGRVPASE